MRESRSASSNQPLAARITSSRAGSPSGKSDFRSASRLIPSCAGVRAPVADLALACPAGRDCALAAVRAPDPALRLAAARPARRFVACADWPATPCARFRCAPSAAARPNVRPHSGQTSSAPAVVAGAALRLVLARFLAATCFFDVAIDSFHMGDTVRLNGQPYAISIRPQQALGQVSGFARDPRDARWACSSQLRSASHR
jgi:hypothetical protein